jgi:hypothetical protein
MLLFASGSKKQLSVPLGVHITDASLSHAEYK